MAEIALGIPEDFEHYRRLLFAIAYRMVGTAMEAEDIVQETYVRYRSARAIRPTQIDNLKGFLTTITTNLCLDYLKAAQTQRQKYFGVWLPEPTVGDEALLDEGEGGWHVDATDPAPTPAEIITQQESISMAFLVILEQLTPLERAILLLRGVFDYSYPEIATMLGKSEANCRQIFHRAQAQLNAQRPRFEVSPENHAALVNQFLTTITQGEMDGLLQMLTGDVVFTTDGGGKASSIVHPLVGPDKVARFILGLVKRGAEQFTVETRLVNGRMALLLYNLQGVLEAIFNFQFEEAMNAPQGGARLSRIYVMRNPEKLARFVSMIGES